MTGMKFMTTIVLAAVFLLVGNFLTFGLTKL